MNNGQNKRSDGVAENWSHGAVLDGIAGLLKQHVVLPEHAAEALALWTLHTYAYKQRDVSTYIGLESPEKRCGKTTLIEVLTELVNEPVATSNISSPALFRVIQETEPTLLIDEADTFLQGNDELRGIMNAGYKRKTAFVWRTVGANAEGGHKLQNPTVKLQGNFNEQTSGSENPERKRILGEGRVAKFSCWCPKLIAAIGRLPDTLADRCIVIRMQRKMQGEQCERIRNLDGAHVRARCQQFVEQHAEAIRCGKPALPGELNDRAADLWEPLIVLAELAGGDWPTKARAAAVALSASAQEASPVSTLLMDIAWLLISKNLERVFSRDIVAWLNLHLDRPWAEARKGKPVDELWLAQRLRPYGLRPKTMRIGEERAKGYENETMREVFRRYIPRTEIDAKMAEVSERKG